MVARYEIDTQENAMKKIKLYLKTALFAVRGTDSIPSSTLIVEGELIEQQSGGWLIRAEQYYSIKGEPLTGESCDLFIPMSKIDHVRVLPS